jgi:glutathione S-transferase
MILFHSPLSPFVRKVMVVLHETGQLGDVSCSR